MKKKPTPVTLYPGWPPSYCLGFGWGACRMCSNGFPQKCQCKPKKQRHD